jgi:MFS family permease
VRARVTAATEPIPDVSGIQRRTLIVISGAQIFSGFGLAAGITVGALLAADVWHNTSLTGVPAVIMTVGAALAALVIGSLSQRKGRRLGLAGGYLAGAVGAAGIVLSVWQGWSPVLLISFLVYGAGSAANLQARFAGADLAPPHRRATAMSAILMATTLGAVLGPVSAKASGTAVASQGLNPLLGPFVVAFAAYALGGLVLAIALRPDPLLVARELHLARAASAAGDANTPRDDAPAPAWRSHVAAAIGIMVIAQAVMVAIMTMTPVHLTQHHHGIGAIGGIIAAHVAAMFLPSPLSGWLVDRFGSLFVAILAGFVLIAAGVVAAVANPGGVVGLTIALVLLGLGWSLAMVSGSAMLTAWAPVAVRPRLQGRSDALTTLAGASGAGMAGVVMGWNGYSSLAWAGAVLAALMIPIAVLVRTRRPATISAS